MKSKPHKFTENIGSLCVGNSIRRVRGAGHKLIKPTRRASAVAFEKCSNCDFGNANLLLALNSMYKVIHKAIREKETSNELWNQMLYAGEAHSAVCILLFCFGECCSVLGNFNYRCRRTLYPKEFMLGGIFLFVVGGRGGYTFNRNRFMKNKCIFQAGTAVSFRNHILDIFCMLTVSPHLWERMGVCTDAGRGLGTNRVRMRAVRECLDGQPRYPKISLGWTDIRVSCFLEIFGTNNMPTWSGCCSHYYERLK